MNDVEPLDPEFDVAAEAAAIEEGLRQGTSVELKRRGLVLGVSGGIDSAVCAALAVRAVGASRVVALHTPDVDTPPTTTAEAQKLCDALGLELVFVDITESLTALGCYEARDEAVRQVFPEYGEGYRSKIAVAEDILDRDRVSYFNLVAQAPDGTQEVRRLPVDVYLRIVAATNMKQRVRKLVEYSHADARNYAVIGTPNRLEFELGFFVRGGDGLADIKPIAHLYKTQVYQMARHVGVPETLQAIVPSTDTYSLPQTQEEFYFGLSLPLLDRLLFAFDRGVRAADAATANGLTAEQVERAYRDITAKRRAASRGLREALLVRPVSTH